MEELKIAINDLKLLSKKLNEDMSKDIHRLELMLKEMVTQNNIINQITKFKEI